MKTQKKQPFDIKNFPPKSKIPAEQRIAMARGRIAQISPFFGTIVSGFPYVDASSWLDTMAIDGSIIYFNRDYVAGLTGQELAYELCHEAMHVVLNHIPRMQGRIHMLANLAADIVLDIILVDSLNTQVFSLPSWVTLQRDIAAEGGHTMEGVYNVLLRKAEKLSGGLGGDDAGTSSGREGSGDIQPKKQQSGKAENLQEQRAKMVLSQAVQAQKAFGQSPLGEGLEALVRDILHPKLPWNVLLRKWFLANTQFPGERTWARPSRRSFALGYLLPSSKPNPGLRRVVIGADWSGSMDDEQRDEIQGELNGIFEEAKPELVDVLYFHHIVARHDTFQKGDPIKLGPCPSGGTRYSPVFEKANKLPELPDICIMFTDMICNDYGPKPPYPVLWVVVNGPKDMKFDPPFGDVLVADDL